MVARRVRILFALLAVAVCVVGALALLSAVFVPKNNQAAFGQHDERANGVMGERQDSIDVLFLGDSEVFTSVDPLQMWNSHGFTSYDVSTSAQLLSYASTLLDRALERQSPRVVVIETDMLFRRVSPDEAIWRTLADALPVLEYHDRWKSLTLADLTSSPKTTWTDDGKGFEGSDAVSPASTEGYMAPSSEQEGIPILNRFYLESIISRCRERGISVVLLSTPSTVNWSWRRHNAVSAFLSARPEFSDVRYLDLNLEQAEVPIDWERDTRDAGDHLNSSGAKKVSDYLGSWLKATYGLTDHRGDQDYHSWDETYRRVRP